MDRPLQVFLITALVLAPLAAQDTSTPAPLPAPLRSAIDRLVTGALSSPVSPVLLSGDVAPAVCSVPLLEMHVDHPERFPMPAAQPFGADDAMPVTKGPAPSCERKP
jgi:hypothetical protein